MDSNPGFKLFFLALLVVGAVLSITLGEFTYGLDLKGGSTVTYSLDVEDGADIAQEVEDTIRILQKRVDQHDRLGVVNIDFIKVGLNQIMVQLPGMDKEDAEAIKKVLTDLGVLEWRIVANEADFARAGVNVADLEAERAKVEEEIANLKEIGKSRPDYRGPVDKGIGWFYTSPDQKEEQSFDGQYCLLDEKNTVGGDKLSKVFLDYDRNGLPGVGFELRSEGAGEMGDLTSNNMGRQMAIVLNGEIHSAPTIEGQITDRGIITGGIQGFGREELQDLIATLKAGSLTIKPRLESENQIGPTLGQEAIERGFIAILIGFIAVVVFMLAVYRMAGFVAITALLCNLLFILAWLASTKGTLTLPGIAGILLTVGMAVDASILIFERVREEREKGKTLPQAFTNGFQIATVTILDANITTFLTALCLFAIGTGPIKGFATTLMTGIVCTLITGVFGSRMIFSFLLKAGIYKEFKAIKLFSKPNIPFLRYSRPALVGSVVAIVLGLTVFVTYEDKLDLDFAGGTLVQMSTTDPVAPETIRNTITTEYEDAEVFPIGDAVDGKYTRFELRSKADTQETQAAFAASIRKLFMDQLVPNGMTVDRLTEGAEGVEEGYVGGYGFKLNLVKPSPVTKIEQSLREAGIERFKVTGGETGDATEYQVMTASLGPTVDEATVRLRVRSGLESQAVLLTDPFPKTDFISPKAVEELTRKAILAILASLVLILLYILFRFQDIRFGYGAVAALVHDVLLTMGVVALFDMLGLVDAKLNLPIIAAFLTIIGYSLNDTIVIFDRIRERLKKVRAGLWETVNSSINETLSRTVFTSVTTFVVVLSLFILNKGQRSVLEGLAFALIIGVITGTYSTIYVASSIVVMLKGRTPGSGDAKPAESKKSKKQPIPAGQA